MLNIFDDAEWRNDALCASTDDPFMYLNFFEDDNELARRFCVGCKVREECLEYAFRSNQPYGIYGGLDERERRKAKRKKPHLREAYIAEILAPYA